MTTPHDAYPSTLHRLQATLQRHHQELGDPPDTSDATSKINAILEATQELLVGETKYTAAVIEQRRQHSVHAIQKITAWTAVTAATCGLAAAVGLTSRGWLILHVPLVLAALLIRAVEPNERPTGQPDRRTGAWILAIAAASAVLGQLLVTFAHLTAWSAALPTILMAIGALIWTSGLAPTGQPGEAPGTERKAKP